MQDSGSITEIARTQAASSREVKAKRDGPTYQFTEDVDGKAVVTLDHARECPLKEVQKRWSFLTKEKSISGNQFTSVQASSNLSLKAAGDESPEGRKKKVDLLKTITGSNHLRYLNRC